MLSINDLSSKNKAGKQVISLPGNAKLIKPCAINTGNDLLALVSLQGRLLLLSVSELPALSKGKGNKLMQIVPKDFAEGNDAIVSATVIPENCPLRINAGKRQLTLKGTRISTTF